MPSPAVHETEGAARQQGLLTKKGARSPGRCHQAGLRAPFLRHLEWFPLSRHTIIRESMSVHLVEGGLAMDACQSCTASPSVSTTSGHCHHLVRLHLPGVDRGNKKGAN
jgi:hypothetical protein